MTKALTPSRTCADGPGAEKRKEEKHISDDLEEKLSNGRPTRWLVAVFPAGTKNGDESVHC